MKKTNITLSIALAAVFSASTAFAEAEVTGKIVHESAKFTTSGIGIGAATTRTQTADSHGKDNFKQETTAKIYIDDSIDELAEGATYHVELNLMKDGKALNDYDSNESYTQRDALREAYIDSEYDDWSIRAGKQQVVWGTADGMKLLDMINPTDYSEMAQNQMEDSRMPIWMINAETDHATGGSSQVIVSQAKSHKIAGLNASGDQGHAFVMKGVDTVTGKVNGFLNIAPALGKVAKLFSTEGGGALGVFQQTTVQEFIDDKTDASAFARLCNTGNIAAATTGTTDAACLHGLANETGLDYGSGAQKAANGEATNLIQATNAEFDGTDAGMSVNADTAFELMNNATFATFEAFVNMETQYRQKHPTNSDMNLGYRFKDSTDDGINWSLNYLNHYDSNPYIDITWEDQNGVTLDTVYVNLASNGNAGAGAGATGNATTTIQLHRAGTNITTGGFLGGSDVANMIFTEKLNRINSYGGSFDTAIETSELGPVVLRGEFLYDQGVKVPVINKAAINIGDFYTGLKSEKADFFKYVIGADITALTNMMVSAQFIQLRNLDFIDETGVTPTVGGVTSNVAGTRYTGDMTTLHLSNSLNKAEENKEFYSLFLSKPFGASGEHRWNNIFMFEENGGKWNRLDAEFSIDDDTQATVEYNKYWGDANTQFGQLEKSSNIQVGVKYSF